MNNTVPVEIQHNDRINNQIKIESIKEEWTTVIKRNGCKKILVNKITLFKMNIGNQNNYCGKLEEEESMMGAKDKEPNFKNLHYQHMNKIKILHNYICKQLESIEECYDIEKMTT